MRIKLIADSTCDLTPELAERYEVEISRLYIQRGDESLIDMVEITPDDIYEYYRQGNGLCKTSAVNVSTYAELYNKFSADYDAIIQFTISSSMSACCQNAMIAAADCEGAKVYVVDSANLSTGIGLLVIAAAEMIEAGMDAAEIYEAVMQLRDKVEASFIIDNLEFLHKGGRCSGIAALGANLLKLKPCIEVRDGSMGVGKKYRGVYDKCVLQYIRDSLSGREDIRTNRIFITHSGCEPKLIEQAQELVGQLQDFDEVLVTRAGTTISSHCGPNTLGVLFIRK